MTPSGTAAALRTAAGACVAALAACAGEPTVEQQLGFSAHALVSGAVTTLTGPVALARVTAIPLRPVLSARGTPVTFEGLATQTDASGRYTLQIRRLEPVAGADDTVSVRVSVSVGGGSDAFEPAAATVLLRFVSARSAPAQNERNFLLQPRPVVQQVVAPIRPAGIAVRVAVPDSVRAGAFFTIDVSSWGSSSCSRKPDMRVATGSALRVEATPLIERQVVGPPCTDDLAEFRHTAEWAFPVPGTGTVVIRAADTTVVRSVLVR